MENTPAFVLLWFSCRNGAGSSADVTLAPLIPLINANVIKIVHQRIYFVRKHLCVCVCANCTITWKGGKCTLSNSNGKNMTFDFATYIVGICAVISMQHYNFLFAKLNFNTFETMLSFFCGSSRGRSRTSFGPFPDALRIALLLVFEPKRQESKWMQFWKRPKKAETDPDLDLWSLLIPIFWPLDLYLITNQMCRVLLRKCNFMNHSK